MMEPILFAQNNPTGFGAPGGLLNSDNNNEALWRQRQRQQTTLRLWMMVLLMLILMQNPDHEYRAMIDSRNKSTDEEKLPTTRRLRQQHDDRIRATARNHVRYEALKKKNDGKDLHVEVNKWAENPHHAKSTRDFSNRNGDNSQLRRLVYRYPKELFTLYQGDWRLQQLPSSSSADLQKQQNRTAAASQTIAMLTKKLLQEANVSTAGGTGNTIIDAKALEPLMNPILEHRNKSIGVFFLPEGLEVNHLKPLANLPSEKPEASSDPISTEKDGISGKEMGNTSNKMNESSSVLPVSGATNMTIGKNESGRASMTFYQYDIVGMKEISLVKGLITLYGTHESIKSAAITGEPIMVAGVLIHSIGRLSLTSVPRGGRTVFFIPDNSSALPEALPIDSRRRRLEESLMTLKQSQVSETTVQQIRDDTLALFESAPSSSPRGPAAASASNHPIMNSVEKKQIQEEDGAHTEQHRRVKEEAKQVVHDPLSTSDKQEIEVTVGDATAPTDAEQYEKQLILSFSESVLPFPYMVGDVGDEARILLGPAGNRSHEGMFDHCEFEVNFDIDPVQCRLHDWKMSALRAAQLEKVTDQKLSFRHKRTPFKGSLPDFFPGATVKKMIGSMHSQNCNFSTSLQINLPPRYEESTAGKAIGYCFYMMLCCLVQIVVLLRQLLHTQARSAASRVSLMCIGWQSVLDSLILCGHVLVSLELSSLFTAFTSVAFFKFLIAAIELKYMRLIIHARDDQLSMEQLHQQARWTSSTVLAVSWVCLALANSGVVSPWMLIMPLYSFWLPQIIRNVVTEYNHPLHNHYVGGMTLTRLLPVVYIFGVPDNCFELLFETKYHNIPLAISVVLWSGLQAAILFAQEKYGARFLIPSIFLPPKYDYSREIPLSLLPQGATIAAIPQLAEESSPSDKVVVSDGPTGIARHTTGVTTRNRINRGRNRIESGMTTETVTTAVDPNTPTLDCVICYLPIDTRNRSGYMIAPCDHIFHKDCLMQWMDVKRDCPICRKELPAP